MESIKKNGREGERREGGRKTERRGREKKKEGLLAAS